MTEQLSTALHAAAMGAELLRNDFSVDAGVADERGKDIKTAADVAAQKRILSVLDSTGIPVLAEEGTHDAVDLNGLVWIVDPLDGTLNFTRGFPLCAVSIALWQDGNPLLGVVHAISGEEVYAGLAGQGAWYNKQAIKVSDITDASQAVLATGFPSGRKYDTDSLLHFVRSVQKYKKVRMLGSAALMLAQVAAGRFDLYEEEDIYLWDVAAGLALVRAAGGGFTMKPGSDRYKYHVRATNGYL